LQQNSIQTQVVDDETEKKQNSGNTMVYFASQKLGILGYAVFFDSLKEEALKLISGLKSQNIVPIILSGDTEASVKNVAHQLGIEEWKSACLPSDKSEYIKVLKAKGHKVAMVGDGINDIEALAVADIGIAVGEGAESAREISGVNLIRNDISLVSFALKIANKTNKTLRTNLFWAFSYNVLMIPLAAGVLYPLTGWMLNPMIAGVAMAFSSVSVLGNSLLLRTLKV
jgi:Cu2+-exporting ATPase